MTQTQDATGTTRPAAESSCHALTPRRDDLAAAAGRLSHDFGNVLTGILGFTELALLHLPPNSAPHRHVQEVLDATQRGVEYINRLHLISQRSPRVLRPSFLQDVVTEEAHRLRAAWGP